MSAAASAIPRELSRAAGLDLGAYRPAHVEERLERALECERLAHVDDLVGLLETHAEARARFRRSIAVSVSGLFRDPSQFDLLEQQLLPALLERGRPLGVWSAGCADGSELYSVAILLDRLGALQNARLLGSDVLEENIAAAQRGVYGDSVLSEHVRAQVSWERRDLTREGPPTGTWQLILCRNVAIYLAPAVKRRLHETLAAALADSGVLLLGRSERLSSSSTLGLERVGPHAYRRNP